MSGNCHITCPQCGRINRLPVARLAAGPNCGTCKHALIDGQARELDDGSFDRFVARNDLPIVVDFWAAWCGPCKMMAPGFALAAQRLAGRALCAKLDTDAAPQTATHHGIRSIPTLIVFRHGREVARQSGALELGNLLAFVEGAIARA